jgi:predicted phage-related endonuclease
MDTECAAWLSERRTGIGGSDAATILGVSPYMTNVELWRIKTGRKIPEDISGKPYVKYGIEAERHLRGLFELNHAVSGA